MHNTNIPQFLPEQGSMNKTWIVLSEEEYYNIIVCTLCHSWKINTFCDVAFSYDGALGPHLRKEKSKNKFRE